MIIVNSQDGRKSDMTTRGPQAQDCVYFSGSTWQAGLKVQDTGWKDLIVLGGRLRDRNREQIATVRGCLYVASTSVKHKMNTSATDRDHRLHAR
jgi:hypothetical protein